MRKRLIVWILFSSILGMALLISSCSSLPIASPGNNSTQPTSERVQNNGDSTSLFYFVDSDPAQVDNSDLPITPTGELHITGVPPKVNVKEYRLSIDGLVETPLSLTYEALLAYPTVTETVLLICPGFFVDNAEWTGVPVTTLLAEAGVKSEATQVYFHALDGYEWSLPLQVIQREGVFLAHTVNGQVLPAEHGYPLRLVLRGRYGSDWLKWVDHIELYYGIYPVK